MSTRLVKDLVDSAKGWEYCVHLGVVLVPTISALQASESGCWLTNPLCTPHSCSFALWQLLTSVQNSPGGDLQSRQNSSTYLGWIFISSFYIHLGHFIIARTTSSFSPLMDYALIFRSAYNSRAMESAQVDYVRLDEYILRQMLDMRRGYTICETIQVSCDCIILTMKLFLILQVLLAFPFFIHLESMWSCTRTLYTASTQFLCHQSRCRLSYREPKFK